MSQFIWLLDNGHGNNTAGKRSPVLPEGGRLFEYEFNRAIVQRLIGLLLSNEIEYRDIVPEETDISLSTRVARANQIHRENGNRGIYVSVHGNAFGTDFNSASGIETYHYQTSTKGREYAGIFQFHLVEELGWRNRGVKTANFRVLRSTSMPAVLTESGFFTNLEECRKMLTPETRDQIAQAHFKSIQYIEGTLV